MSTKERLVERLVALRIQALAAKAEQVCISYCDNTCKGACFRSGISEEMPRDAPRC